MKKLKGYLEKLTEGKKVRGFNLTLYDIQELLRIYNSKLKKEECSFINGKCKEVLDKCNIKTIPEGIGWRIA